jgi:quercetin dioxygenase-like cupin family protein
MSEQPYVHFQDALAPPNGNMEWGRLVWLANHDLVGMGATFGYVEIAAGTGNPLHRHSNCSEALLLIEGELEHAVGDEWLHLATGDVLVVPPGMDHGARNPGLTVARMVVVYDSGDRAFEAVT